MNEQWLYAVDGTQYGPVTRDDVQRFLAEGRLRPTDAVWTEGMAQWIEARYVRALSGDAPAVAAAAPFFPIGIPKLAVMVFGTFGLYELYWFYKQWSTIRKRTGEEMWPVARAIFVVFFFHELVKRVNETGREYGFLDPLSVGGLTTLFILPSVTWRIPGALGLLAFLAVIPMMIVQKRMNDIHAKTAPFANPNRNIRAWNWLAMFLGLPFFAFSVWATLAEGL